MKKSFLSFLLRFRLELRALIPYTSHRVPKGESRKLYDAKLNDFRGERAGKRNVYTWQWKEERRNFFQQKKNSSKC